MKKAQVEKVAQELLEKYGVDTAHKIAKCAIEAQSSKGEDLSLREIVETMDPKDQKKFTDKLKNVENTKQAKFIGCLLESNGDWREQAKKRRTNLE